MPFIVLDGSDLEAALDGVMVAKMRNAGEACTAANRLWVHAASTMRSLRLTQAHGGARHRPGHGP